LLDFIWGLVGTLHVGHKRDACGSSELDLILHTGHSGTFATAVGASYRCVAFPNEL
jgi:hypothetical protein